MSPPPLVFILLLLLIPTTALDMTACRSQILLRHTIVRYRGRQLQVPRVKVSHGYQDQMFPPNPHRPVSEQFQGMVRQTTYHYHQLRISHVMLPHNRLPMSPSRAYLNHRRTILEQIRRSQILFRQITLTYRDRQPGVSRVTLPHSCLPMSPPQAYMLLNHRRVVLEQIRRYQILFRQTTLAYQNCQLRISRVTLPHNCLYLSLSRAYMLLDRRQAVLERIQRYQALCRHTTLTYQACQLRISRVTLPHNCLYLSPPRAYMLFDRRRAVLQKIWRSQVLRQHITLTYQRHQRLTFRVTLLHNLQHLPRPPAHFLNHPRLVTEQSSSRMEAPVHCHQVAPVVGLLLAGFACRVPWH
jgi:hypothetical protein